MPRVKKTTRKKTVKRKNANNKKQKEVKRAGIVSSMREVGEAIGVAQRTVANWSKKGMPTNNDGTYDIIEIKAWRDAISEQESNPGAGEHQQDFLEDDWDIRYRKAKAELAELSLAEKRGDLLSRESVELAMHDRISSIKKQFLSFPKQVAPQIIGLETNEAEHVLMTRIKEIIQGFADGKF